MPQQKFLWQMSVNVGWFICGWKCCQQQLLQTACYSTCKLSHITNANTMQEHTIGYTIRQWYNEHNLFSKADIRGSLNTIYCTCSAH